MASVDEIKRTWIVNGRRTEVRAVPGRRVLDILREELGLTGTKEGCGEGECGACTVLLDGEAAASCLLTAGQVADGTAITTIEGAMETELGRVLQKAYMDAGAVQCGFCIPGMILSSLSLLERNAHPSEEDVRAALAGNLCRCTGYVKIVEAVMLAAERWNGGKGGES